MKFVLLIAVVLALACVCSVDVSARATSKEASLTPEEIHPVHSLHPAVHRSVAKHEAKHGKAPKAPKAPHTKAPKGAKHPKGAKGLKGKVGLAAPMVGDGSSDPCITELGINADTSLTAPINPYPDPYQANKANVLNALRATSMTECQIRMWFAIGMLETNTFSAADRDTSKDGTASQNYSCFNLNQDMLTRAGQPTDALNSDANIQQTANAVAAMTTQYGINGVLNYLRGGYTGWQDGVSYDCAGYRQGINSLVYMIDQQTSVLTDNTRIDLDISHV